MGKKRKAKKVNYELIDDDNQDVYALLQRARREWHEDLDGATIALAWRHEVKPDADGQISLGKCVKLPDLQKELAPYDFVIVLNKVYWDDFSEDQRLALLDHELSHAAPALDKACNQIVDSRGRKVWRCRKHDVQEFRAIIERHGPFKADLVEFAQALDKHRDGQGDLFEPAAGDDLKVTLEHDGERVETTGRAVRKAAEKASGKGRRKTKAA